MKKAFLPMAAAFMAISLMTSCGGGKSATNDSTESIETTNTEEAIVDEALPTPIDSFTCKVRATSSYGEVKNGFRVKTGDTTINIYKEEGDNVDLGIVVEASSKMKEPFKSLKSIDLTMTIFDKNHDPKVITVLDKLPLSPGQLKKAEAMMKANDKDKTEQYVFTGQITKAKLDSIKTIKDVSLSITARGEE